jgi:hypothetical protein
VLSRDADLPYVVEAAFAYVPEEAEPRHPLQSFATATELAERIDDGRRKIHAGHGKSAIALKGEAAESGVHSAEYLEDAKHWANEVWTAYDGSPADDLITAVKSVTYMICVAFGGQRIVRRGSHVCPLHHFVGGRCHGDAVRCAQRLLAAGLGRAIALLGAALLVPPLRDPGT